MNRLNWIGMVMLISIFTPSKSQDIAINWLDIEEAQKVASQSRQPIFLDITADWCGWCRKMNKTTFQDQEVVMAINQGLVPVRLDFERVSAFVFNGKEYTAKMLAKELGIEGLPTMVVISSDLKRFELIIGYQHKGQFLHHLKKYRNW